MDASSLDAITDWVVGRGLTGALETDLLKGFGERCIAAGLALSRAVAVIDTLHPTFEGRAFRWRNDGIEEPVLVEYGRTTHGEAADNWRQSIFHHLLATGGQEARCRLFAGDAAPFRDFETMRSQGQSDVLALIHRFAGAGVVGEMDCIYSLWATRTPGGFSDDDLAALRRLVPPVALAIKCAALKRIAETLVEVYLGHDPGRRVMEGRISRGVADRIRAVLWYSDLRGYTTISDAAAPEEIIPFLNDYAEAVVSAVEAAGGDVLKLMGDGTLAIFKADDAGLACRSALAAERDMRSRITALAARRGAEGRPVTSVYLGLHIGDVFYGNIGSNDRLDFTVVGPAVNEASRIASMCRSVERAVVLSSDFAAATPEPERSTLVSVGRFALRGVSRAQELFTLDPALLAPSA
jgi:adenylate cyclase